MKEKTITSQRNPDATFYGGTYYIDLDNEWPLGHALNSILKNTMRPERLRLMIFETREIIRGCWSLEDAAALAEQMISDNTGNLDPGYRYELLTTGWEQHCFPIPKAVGELLRSSEMFQEKDEPADHFLVKLPEKIYGDSPVIYEASFAPRNEAQETLILTLFYPDAFPSQEIQ